MKILIIDDDRVFAEPLLWRLSYDRHQVTYCQSVSEVLDGWYEVLAERLQQRDPVASPAFVSALERVVGERFHGQDECITRMRANGWLGDGPALQRAIDSCLMHSVPLKEDHDIVLLDMMMPRENVYTEEETDQGRRTGIVLLKSIVKSLPKVPVFVITVRQSPDFHLELRSQFPYAVRSVLVKPIAPEEVVHHIMEFISAEP